MTPPQSQPDALVSRVQALGKVIMQIGIMPAIAGGLIYLLGVSMSAKVEKILDVAREHHTQFQLFDRDQSAVSKEILRIQRQICRNTAKNRQEMNLCD